MVACARLHFDLLYLVHMLSNYISLQVYIAISLQLAVKSRGHLKTSIYIYSTYAGADPETRGGGSQNRKTAYISFVFDCPWYNR